MSKQNKKRRQRGSATDGEVRPDDRSRPQVTKPNKKPLIALNKGQDRYLKSIKSNILTIGTGPAGTGKSYMAGAMAAAALQNNETEKIYITRPAEETGRGLGFLKGTLEEKYEPYFRPFRDVLEERLGKSYVEYLVKRKTIEALPLEFMRGMTLKNAWVILDEAQNACPVQMKMFLTRTGDDVKVIINGDMNQQDIRGKSGLQDAVDRLKGIDKIGLVHMGVEDIVRSGLTQCIIERYESYNENTISETKAIGEVDFIKG